MDMTSSSSDIHVIWYIFYIGLLLLFLLDLLALELDLDFDLDLDLDFDLDFFFFLSFDLLDCIYFKNYFYIYFWILLILSL